MKTPSILLLGAAMALGACANMPMPDMPAAAPAATSNVPQEVRDIAAPFQNVDSARVLEEDNCYWYEHQGPVETTLLPLRSVRGNPICAAPPAVDPAAAPATAPAAA